MNEKITNLKKLDVSENINLECSVSQASNELMLHRISDGEDLEFPFSPPNQY